MSAPTAPMAARLYEYLGYTRAHAQQDVDNGYAAAKMCTAQMAPIEAAGLVADNPSLWADPVNAPDELIRNMAMRASLRNAYGETIPRLRDRLANPPAFETGSTDAVREAVRGVVGDPLAAVSIKPNKKPGVSGYTWGHTTIIVSASTAGSVTEAQIQTAAEQAEVDWVVVHVHIGTTWAQVASQHSTWTDAATDHATWSDMAGGH